MIRKLILPTVLVLPACSFSNVEWEQGTYAVTEVAVAPGADECGLVSVFESIEPLTYELGPEIFGIGFGINHTEAVPTESQTEDGLANLWSFCTPPDLGSSVDRCINGIELLHTEAWLPQVELLLYDHYTDCEEGSFAVGGSYSNGGLLSKTTALFNSTYRFSCGYVINEGSSYENYMKPSCYLDLTSRLALID